MARPQIKVKLAAGGLAYSVHIDRYRNMFWDTSRIDHPRQRASLRNRAHAQVPQIAEASDGAVQRASGRARATGFGTERNFPRMRAPADICTKWLRVGGAISEPVNVIGGRCQ